jgi:hypothetical protein
MYKLQMGNQMISVVCVDDSQLQNGANSYAVATGAPLSIEPQQQTVNVAHGQVSIS